MIKKHLGIISVILSLSFIGCTQKEKQLIHNEATFNVHLEDCKI